jgi:hypothetical protein
MSPAPEALLAEAQRLLDGEHDLDCWPIAAAILLRCALEASVERHLIARGDIQAGASIRAQLLALATRRTGDRTAESAAVAWTELSRGVHHHAYELAPTAGELRRLQGLVDDVVAMLALKTPGQIPGSHRERD